MVHFKKQSVETKKLATVDLFLSPCFHIFKTPEVLGCGRDVMKFNSIQAGIKSTLVLTKFVIFFYLILYDILCIYIFVFVTIVFEKCQNVFDIHSSNSFDIVQCKKHASMSILLQFSRYIFASTGLPKTLRRLLRSICHIKDLQLEQITTNSK